MISDDEALKMAVEIARRDPKRRDQVDGKLQDEDWRSVAEFCAYSCQVDALQLKPWQEPPCWEPTGGPGKRLRDRMRAAGISKFHPDPLEALMRSGL